jgi:hypothetical protein
MVDEDSASEPRNAVLIALSKSDSCVGGGCARVIRVRYSWAEEIGGPWRGSVIVVVFIFVSGRSTVKGMRQKNIVVAVQHFLRVNQHFPDTPRSSDICQNQSFFVSTTHYKKLEITLIESSRPSRIPNRSNSSIPRYE